MLRELKTGVLHMIREAETDCGLEFHPLSLSFPLLEGADFDAYVADVRAKGPTDKIFLLDDKILDGRNLARALAKIHPRFSPETHPRLFVDYVGKDPLGFLVSRNIRRRHLNPSQRAVLAAELCNRNPASRFRPGTKIADAARAFEVSPSHVKEAKHIARAEGREAIDQIKRGERLIGKRGQVKAINVVLALDEHERFVERCRAVGRTATDVLREFIAKVGAGKIKLAPMP